MRAAIKICIWHTHDQHENYRQIDWFLVEYPCICFGPYFHEELVSLYNKNTPGKTRFFFIRINELE